MEKYPGTSSSHGMRMTILVMAVVGTYRVFLVVVAAAIAALVVVSNFFYECIFVERLKKSEECFPPD